MAERPWFGERNAPDDETTRVRIQEGPPPLGTPAPPDALPQFIAGWPAPPGPQRLDRDRELPGFPPAVPDVGIERPAPATGDERWTMTTPVPRAVGTAWETRPAPETFATPAVAPPAPPAPPAPTPTMDPRKVQAALAQQALEALVSPLAQLQRQAQLGEAQRVQQESWAAQQQLTAAYLEDRRKLHQKMSQGMEEYRQELKKGLPAEPTLKELPPTPDVKIRPWLDPEGKNALVVMMQGLQAMALAAGGMALKTPQTMLGHLRQAAEDWRRDEVDRAASNMKQFELEATKVQHDNGLALQRYEIQDRRRVTNLEAKKAALLTDLQEMGLEEQALVAATLPYEQARQATKAFYDHATAINNSLTTWATVNEKLNKAKGETMGKSVYGLTGQRARLQKQLAETQDPDEKAEIQRNIDMVTTALKDGAEIEGRKMQTAATIRAAGTEIPKQRTRLTFIRQFMNDVVRLDDAVQIVKKAGVVPTTPTPIHQWVSSVRQMFPKAFIQNPQLDRAVFMIEELVPMMIGSYERNVENVINLRHGKFFKIPENPTRTMTANQLDAMIGWFRAGMEDAKALAEEKIKAYQAGLPQTGGVLFSEPESEEPE